MVLSAGLNRAPIAPSPRIGNDVPFFSMCHYSPIQILNRTCVQCATMQLPYASPTWLHVWVDAKNCSVIGSVYCISMVTLFVHSWLIMVVICRDSVVQVWFGKIRLSFFYLYQYLKKYTVQISGLPPTAPSSEGGLLRSSCSSSRPTPSRSIKPCI